MEDEIPKIKIKLKDKQFEVDFTSELEQFNKDIISILEKEYKKKLTNVNIYIGSSILMKTMIKFI